MKKNNSQKAQLYSSKNKKASLFGAGLLMLVLGVSIFLLPFLVETIATNSTYIYCSWALGITFLIVAFVIFYKIVPKKKKEEKKEEAEELEVDASEVDVDDENPQMLNRKQAQEPVVHYIPLQSVFQFMNAGIKQPMEEKFQQIYRMDHNQFVMYIARLFAARGFVVKLTPVIDNHGIDMVVERDNSSFAVSCINRYKRLVTEDDLTHLATVTKYFAVKSIMVLTSSYFDRTAMDFIKAKKFSAVDRSILEEDFIRAVDFRR